MESGSYANAYRASKNGQNYVIKAIKMDKIQNNPKSIENLRREIGNQMKLVHPNIVSGIEEFVHENAQYVVLEYCDGGDLCKYINKKGCLSEKEAIPILKGICAGY